MTDNEQAEAVVNGLAWPEPCRCPVAHRYDRFVVDSEVTGRISIMCSVCKGVLSEFERPR